MSFSAGITILVIGMKGASVRAMKEAMVRAMKEALVRAMKEASVRAMKEASVRAMQETLVRAMKEALIMLEIEVTTLDLTEILIQFLIGVIALTLGKDPNLIYFAKNIRSPIL